MTLTKEEQDREPGPKTTRMPDDKLEHPFGITDERSEDDIFFTEMEIELLLGGLQAQSLPDEATIEELNWAAPAIIKFLLQTGQSSVSDCFPFSSEGARKIELSPEQMKLTRKPKAYSL